MSSQPAERSFLITGCGRSGTGWASALFTALGYPCGHESLYNLWQEGPLSKPESSWLAIPHLESLGEGVSLLRIMRDPYLVVQSAVERGFLANMSDPYDLYVRTHRPDITSAPSHLGRVIRWVALWDQPLDDFPCRLFRTGDPDLDTVRYATGEDLSAETLREAVVSVGSKVNTNLGQWTSRPTVAKISDHPDGSLLADRATRFGYLS